MCHAQFVEGDITLVCEMGEWTESPDATREMSDTLVSSVMPHAAKTGLERHDAVLLQTVRAWTVRCLMHGGSQHSFIHDRWVKALRLPTVKIETLQLHTFGSMSTVTKDCNVIKLVLENIWNNNKKNWDWSCSNTTDMYLCHESPCRTYPTTAGGKRAVVSPCASMGKRRSRNLFIDWGRFLLEDSDWQNRMIVRSLGCHWNHLWLSRAWTSGYCMSSLNEATCMNIGIYGTATELSNQLCVFWDIDSLGITSNSAKTPEETEAKLTWDFSKGIMM